MYVLFFVLLSLKVILISLRWFSAVQLTLGGFVFLCSCMREGVAGVCRFYSTCLTFRPSVKFILFDAICGGALVYVNI